MDDKELQDILKKQPTPAVDENAKKRALNLANAAFSQEQKKNTKTSQGFANLLRLIGITNTKTRNETMEDKRNKKFIYGGMATAMAAIVVVGLGVNQLDDAVERFNTASILSEEIDEGAGAKSDQVKSAYIQAVEQANTPIPVTAIETKLETPSVKEEAADPLVGLSDLQDERVNNPPPLPKKRVTSNKNSVIAIPTPTSDTRLEIPDVETEIEDPLQRWRMLQDERVARDLGKSQGDRQGNIPKSKGYIVEGPTKSEAESAKSDDVSSIAAPSLIPEKKAKVAESIIPKPERVAEDPLHRWRKLQDERVERELARQKMEVETFKENPFTLTSEAPVSTFSSDVDTASYSLMRKSLNNGVLPQKHAVRIEELINYFDYDYAVPESKAEPFKPTVTVTDSPWSVDKKLMHIGIKGYDIVDEEKPRSNLVFLLDVSGSMNSHDKLPLLKNSLKLLLDTLGPEDTVAIAVYAGAAGTVLEPTSVAEKHKIISALDRLNAGGSTAGAAGIRLAYDLAQENFDEQAINRVILATDGDFNVGITNQEELKGFVERKRQSGVFLSVLGFGRGNYNDQMMQTLAQNGNGVAAYIDSLNEARKVLVEEASSSLFPIAKDVKFQIEFNPAAVAEYRLIGYETRHLEREDFNNDKVDAGDIGAGHSVTAIYEFTPAGSKTSVDPLRYGKKKAAVKPIASSDEYGFLKVRYKLPNENISKLITTPVRTNVEYKRDMKDIYFATAVAAFGQIIKGGTYTGTYSMDDVISLAQAGKGTDEFGYRSEFIQLVRLAKVARAQ